MDHCKINLQNYEHVRLPTLYQQQTHRTKYSRWNDDLERRETWPETVYRYISFMVNHVAHYGYILTEEEQIEIFEGILNLEIMPSMRAMMTAGRALELDNAAAYNCGYAPVDRYETHDEAFYLSMCSVGVGFSVERQFTGQLPTLPSHLAPGCFTIEVPDTRIGWAESYRTLIEALYSGYMPDWDVSRVRPRGARLRTFGGRSSGPEPLIDLFKYTIMVFQRAIDDEMDRLSSFDNHDLMTKMADVAVSGGVRRAAMISLSNPSDDRMRDAKSGNWFNTHPHFALANNSAVWTDRPNAERFMAEWLALVKSKAGERGVINRKALVDQARRTRRLDVDKYSRLYGLNPCGEIILRPRQFCNLATNIIRADDGLADLLRKIRLTAIIGTMQSTLTEFRYLSPEWKKNCEEERLLGVSLNGVFDNRYMAGLDYIRDGTYLTENFVMDGVKVELPDALAILRDTAVEVNKEWADKLGIRPSAAITTIKPEGNNSELVGCSSGLHGAHAKNYYIRTNRANKVDKLAQFMVTKGVVAEDDVTTPDVKWVFYFPKKTPDGAVTRHDYTAIEHLKIWSLYQEYYCEHKPSITVSVRDDEWFAVGSYVYDNFDRVSGIAFLPFSDYVYRQAPYIECTEKEYQDLLARTPSTIPWEEFHEDSDYTTAVREIACMSGVCTLD